LRKPTVVIYRPVDETARTHEDLARAGCDVIVEPVDLNVAAISDAALEADVLMGATFRAGVMDEAFLRRFPRLRLVSKYTIGYDDVDLDAASALGIAVSHCPTEANWGGVAEGAMALMLTIMKRIREKDRQVKAGSWRDEALRGIYLGARGDGYPGITVGIIGLGRVGSRLAELLAPWRVRVIAYDPYVEDAAFTRLNVARCPLEELLRSSDVVSLHCALTAETRGLIGRDALALMKRTAVLLNTARGAVVDWEALLGALEAGRPAAAALDVFPQEPPAIDERVTVLGDRLLLSPHMVAANAGGTLLAAAPWGADAALEALRGRWPSRVVNPEIEARWLQRFGGRSLLPASAGASVSGVQ
jgi:phosphoglycerate dehydrogenase-like enzyme